MRRAEGGALLLELRNARARSVTPPHEMREWEARIFHQAHDAVRDHFGGGNHGTRTQPMSEIWDRALAAGVVTRGELELVRDQSGDLWTAPGPTHQDPIP